jgi:hypothetical protein
MGEGAYHILIVMSNFHIWCVYILANSIYILKDNHIFWAFFKPFRNLFYILLYIVI